MSDGIRPVQEDLAAIHRTDRTRSYKPAKMTSARASIVSAMEVEGGLTLEDFEWQEGPQDMEDFLANFDLPQIVKVDSGDYGNFGTGTHVDVARPFLLAARRSCSKVLAASVYWEDSRQEYVEVGPRLVIPVTYKGWFWYLQDHARVGKAWTAVEEVATARPRPRSIMIRKPITCYRTSGVLRAGVQRIYTQEDLNPGDILTVGDVYTESVPADRGCCFLWLPGRKYGRKVKEIKYLQCRDPNGNDVLLEFNQTGEFNPIGEAGTMLEGAVYRLPDVLPGSALPMYVKLAHGQPPSSPCSFTGLLRLEEVYMEETVIACCLGRAIPTMVEFPTDSDIQFICATNGADMLAHEPVAKAFDFCDSNIEHYVTTMKVVQNFYPDHIRCENGSTLKGRALPDLPEVSHDQVSEMAESIDTMTTEDFSEDDDSDSRSDEDCDTLPPYPAPPCEEESNYEVIPGDQVGGVHPKRPLVDEDGYLSPLNMYSKMDPPDPPEPAPAEKETAIQTIFMDRGNKLVLKIENTTSESSDDIPDVPDKPRPRPISIVHNHLELIKQKTASLDRNANRCAPSFSQIHRQFPSWHAIPICEASSSHERLDDLSLPARQDSKLPPIPNNNYPNKLSTPQPPDLETNEGVHDFLDKLFDYDAMDIEQRTIQRLLGRRSSLGDMALPPTPKTSRNDRRRESDSFVVGSLRRKPPLRFAFSNPDATLRVHNVKSLGLMNPNSRLSYTDEHPDLCAPFPRDPDERLQLETMFAPLPDLPQMDHLDPRYGGDYQDLGIPSTPSSEADLGERRANRSDSGIYLSRWADPLEGESPYLSPSEDAWTPPEDLASLSVLDVARCLRYIGMKQHVVLCFLEEQVDGKQLQELNDELLREGMPQLNAFERKKVLDFTQGWRPKKL